jgi:dephospho-CoA kinase
MLLVGLTGGIGAGKSTVAELLRERGAVVIDADDAGRVVVEPGKPALRALVEHFGDGILNPDGSLDRPALADLAFASEESKAVLNGITWPAMREEIQRQIDAAPPDSVVVCDAALLLESDFAKQFMRDVVIVVEAPIDVRLDRLVLRGLRPEDAARRLATQMTDDERRAHATHVIENDGDLADLEPRVDALWKELRAIAAAKWAGNQE